MKPTYFDYIRRHDPELLEVCRKDAEYLGKRGMMHFASYADFPSTFPGYLDKESYEIQLEEVRKIRRSIAQKVPGAHPDQLKEMPQTVKVSHDTKLIRRHHEHSSLTHFILSGKKTFLFNDNLADQLLVTEVNIQAELIESPFNCCLFSISSKSAIEALYALCESGPPGSIDYSSPISVFVTLIPPFALISRPHLSSPYRQLCIDVYHCNGDDFAFSATEEFLLKPDWDLRKILDCNWSEEGPSADTTSDYDDYYHYDIQRRVGPLKEKLFFRLIFNCLLYVNSRDPDLVPSTIEHQEHLSQVRRAQVMTGRLKQSRLAKLEGKSFLDYEEAGRSLGAIRIDDKNLDGSEAGALGTPGRSPSVRFMVRGHWRNQVHGEGRKDRKLLWIKPFLKGPEMADLINRPYEVTQQQSPPMVT